MRSDVTLRQLDEDLLQDLLAAAVSDADPCEVMPPMAGTAGWTAERRTAFSNAAGLRLIAAPGFDHVHEGDAVTVWVDLKTAGSQPGPATYGCPPGG